MFGPNLNFGIAMYNTFAIYLFAPYDHQVAEKMVEILQRPFDETLNEDNNFLSSFEAFANGLSESNGDLLSQTSLLSDDGSNQQLSQTSPVAIHPPKIGDITENPEVRDNEEVLLSTDDKEETKDNNIELEESSELRQNIDDILGDLEDEGPKRRVKEEKTNKVNLLVVKDKEFEEILGPMQEKLTALRKSIPNKMKASRSKRKLPDENTDSSKSKKAKKNKNDTMTSKLIKDVFSSKSCMKIVPKTTKISFKPPDSKSESSIKQEEPETEKNEKSSKTKKKKEKKKQTQPLVKNESSSNTEDVLSRIKLGKGIKISETSTGNLKKKEKVSKIKKEKLKKKVKELIQPLIKSEPVKVEKKGKNKMTNKTVKPLKITGDVLSKLKLGKGIKISFDGPSKDQSLKRKFVCSKCKADFETKPDFREHFRANHLPILASKEPEKKKIDLPTVQCDECKQTFEGKQHLKNHTKEKHPQFKCDRCSMAFGLKSELKVHKKSEHPDYTCDCDEKFATLALFQKHRKDKHTDFKCDECEEAFKNKHILADHVKEKHPKNKCEECDSLFSIRNDLYKHIRESHPAIKCEECESSFSTRTLLQKHKKDEHPGHECNICHDMLPTKISLKKHTKDLHYMSCFKCISKFKSEEDLERHMKSRHEVSCNKCEKRFDNKVDFLAHKEEYHTYSCTVETCKQIFDDVQRLDKHVVDSHNLKCPHCPEHLETRQSLHQHVQSLHGHVCPDCPLTFQTRALMVAHLKAEHQTCAECEDEFSWAEADHECYYTRSGVRPGSYH